jgi:hypothetical protein
LHHLHRHFRRWRHLGLGISLEDLTIFDATDLPVLPRLTPSR